MLTVDVDVDVDDDDDFIRWCSNRPFCLDFNGSVNPVLIIQRDAFLDNFFLPYLLIQTDSYVIKKLLGSLAWLQPSKEIEKSGPLVYEYDNKTSLLSIIMYDPHRNNIVFTPIK